MPAMNLYTTRFGTLPVEPDDMIHFPGGLLGLEDCSHWVLLADAQNEALGWLQSITRPEVALAVVSPRRFVTDYQVRASRSELGPLLADLSRDVHVLVVVSKSEHTLTLNLKAPLIVSLDRRLGRQVVNNGDYPVQFELCRDPLPLRKTA